MCGIVGIVRPGRPIRNDEISRFTRAVAHRGPDDEGVWRHGDIAIGHSRLSVIDIDHGQQPMSSHDHKIWLTYNGEIYNFRELRAELGKRGHSFRTLSDTEVIISAYREWGPGCVERFRGMFAFGLVDLEQNRIFLARDHFGIKPLFYRVTSEQVTFASEIKALRTLESLPPQGSLAAVDQYLKFQYIPCPYTIYQDTFKLPPAHHLFVHFDGHIEQPRRYWNLGEQPKLQLSDGEWTERLGDAIKESVKAHMVADVPFGIQISGGNDSTAVAWALIEVSNGLHPAFSVDFVDKKYSELEFARIAADTLGLDLTTRTADEGLLEMLPELVVHCGEPFGDSSIMPTWLLSKSIREKVPVVLSGDGGDEAFAGYGWYQKWVNPAHDFSNNETIDWMLQLERWEEGISYFNKPQRLALWRSDVHDHFHQKQHNGTRQDLMHWSDKSDLLRFVQTLDYQTYLHGDILHKMDIASMYHGLEVRTPLVDVKIAELAATTPIDQRIRVENNQCTSKFVLKNLLSGRFDRSFTHRAKHGFCIPRDEWLSPGTRANALASEIVLSSSSTLKEWFNPGTLKEACDRAENDRGQLWLLLVLGLWLDANRDITFQ